MKILQKTKQTGGMDSKEIASLSDKVKSLSQKLTKEIADVTRKTKSDVASIEQKVEALRKERNEMKSEQDAKKEVN